MSDFLPGVHQAPNIQTAPDLYEIENHAADPEGKLETAMYALMPWDNKIFVDLGAGTGFHLPRFAKHAQHVFGVEPHDASRMMASQYVMAHNLTNVSVMTGSAERIFLPDASVDVLHARFAYFFAPHCVAGLKEVERVMRRGGAAFIIDNDLRSGTFAKWLGLTPYYEASADDIEQFWREQGYQLLRVPSEWRFQTRADLEAVVKLEFGEKLGAELVKQHEGLSVEYHYALYYRVF
jgi:SAM-dependent methyltransferase